MLPSIRTVAPAREAATAQLAAEPPMVRRGFWAEASPPRMGTSATWSVISATASPKTSSVSATEDGGGGLVDRAVLVDHDTVELGSLFDRHVAACHVLGDHRRVACEWISEPTAARQ